MACLEFDPTFENLDGMGRVDFDEEDVLFTCRRGTLNSDCDLPGKLISMQGPCHDTVHSHCAS